MQQIGSWLTLLFPVDIFPFQMSERDHVAGCMDESCIQVSDDDDVVGSVGVKKLNNNSILINRNQIKIFSNI